jgi:ornithine cyclodeaminase/alanine dehydrogenase
MYVITLFDKQTGELAYLIDAVAITGIRTAATSAVALDLLSADIPLRLAVLGSGLEASKHVEAIAKVRPIASLQVFSPTAANRERFANEWGTRLQVASQAHSSPESAVRGATHVIAAARSRGEQPILRGDWLSAGAVVISIGSTTPSQRELDASVIERAAVIVADVPHELADDTGDMIAATEAAIPFREKLFSLQQLVQGAIPQERLSPDGILLFKSVGSALQDIVFAESVAAAAERKGFGTRLSLDMRIKQSIGKNS